MPDLTAERLREVLHYTPETGVFVWKIRKRGIRRRTADARMQNGYVCIRINGVLYLAHRLAWLYVHGQWPPTEIDHVNGEPDDNRLVNLRLASSSQNKTNARRRSDNTSGFKGVVWDKRIKNGKPWTAQIHHRGRHFCLGYFDNPQDAHAAYMSKARELFGEYARAG